MVAWKRYVACGVGGCMKNWRKASVGVRHGSMAVASRVTAEGRLVASVHQCTAGGQWVQGFPNEWVHRQAEYVLHQLQTLLHS